MLFYRILEYEEYNPVMTKKFHQPRKRFGQHFLVDSHVIADIVACISPREGDRCVEIGPGFGALTIPVLHVVGELDVIELDRDVIPHLKLLAEDEGTLRVHQADVLSFDFATLGSSAAPIRVYGNLPYNISTPLIFHLLDYVPIISDMHFMLQKEMVDRLAAKPNSKAYGRLSVMVQYFCDVEANLHIGPEAFKPPPKVDSAIVSLFPRQQIKQPVDDLATFTTVVKMAFAHKRKTLRNCLKSLISGEDLQKLEINPTSRAENLSVQDYVRISNFVGKYSTM